MSEPIKVAVAGAAGRMGREVVKMVLQDPELKLVAAVNLSDAGLDAGTMVGLPACGVALTGDLEQALSETQPRVLVDFTTPQSAYANTELAIRLGVSPVVGTTGFTPEQIENLDKLCQARDIGGLIAPNFSIGAILMMRFAAQAAKYFPHLEIIEYHGDQKLDAPSGTAVKTAELIAQSREELRQGNPNEEETIEGQGAVIITVSGYIAFVCRAYLPSKRSFSAASARRLKFVMIPMIVPATCRGQFGDQESDRMQGHDLRFRPFYGRLKGTIAYVEHRIYCS